jgi:UDPglucose 6-dehydrogenase
MKIGFIGLGKLGLPVALAIEDKGHTVFGYDIDPNIKKILEKKKIPYKEKGANALLKKSKIKFASILSVAKKSDLIFVAIQTPHEDKYEGITRIPKTRKDFNYKYLIKGLKDLSKCIDLQKIKKDVIIISTVLPGTIKKYIKPIISKYINLTYNPFFIAMGTTIDNFLQSEMILMGTDKKESRNKLTKFYKSINNSPIFKTNIENAELIKVVYNTFISTKISFINSVMETCRYLPNTDIDEISRALFLCKDRIISNKYLIGGMGDGGGCHPRDNIALSWLANKLNLSYNWYDNIMKQREFHTIWLAKEIIKNKKKRSDRIFILGKCFKPETNLIVGSPAILLKNILEEFGEKVVIWDPYVDGNETQFKTKYNLNKKPSLYFIGTKHNYFKNYKFTKNSIIIDPFRYLNLKKSVKYIPLGKSIL